MVSERSWEEFRASGLLWWINMVLHTFGWAIVYEFEDSNIKRVYPARVKFRGFQEELNTEGYKAVSSYIKDNADELWCEANE